MTGAPESSARDELETAISEALTRAWCMAVTYAAVNLVTDVVPLGYPEVGPETAKLLAAVDAWSGRCAAQQSKLAPGNAEVAYEQWIEQRNPDDVGSMAGFVAGWQVAITAASGWPLCPNGCGCRLGTGDADMRDCACDGLCCYDEIEVSELFAERDRLRKELHERDAQLADALTPTAADFDHAAEIVRLRDTCEADIASLTDQRNRISDTADQFREQLAAAVADASQARDALGVVMTENRQRCERIDAIAEGLEHRAEINRPSKVSEICDNIAASLRRVLEGKHTHRPGVCQCTPCKTAAAIATAGTEHLAAQITESRQA